MPRLIDADALPVTTLTDGGYWTKDVVYKADIDAAPTIDPESLRPHGRWVEHGYKWQCSSCGVLMDIDGTPQENLLNYCPNCGAKMDEEET